MFHWHRTVLPAWRPALRRKTYQLAPSRCKCAPPSPMHRVSVLACRCERGAGGCGHSIAPCSRAMHLITVVSAGFRVRRELVRGLFSNETTPLGKLRVGPCFAWRFGPPRPPSMTGSAKYGCATSSLGCLSRTGPPGPRRRVTQRHNPCARLWSGLLALRHAVQACVCTCVCSDGVFTCLHRCAEARLLPLTRPAGGSRRPWQV